MKLILPFLFFLTVSLGFSQNKKEAPKTQVVEAACGQCQFGIEGKKGCDLAVRINGKSYFVEGTKIDDHGDAHGKGGMCSAIRQAKVAGEIVNDKYVVTSFHLLPEEERK